MSELIIKSVSDRLILNRDYTKGSVLLLEDDSIVVVQEVALKHHQYDLSNYLVVSNLTDLETTFEIHMNMVKKIIITIL
jgi:hypothetical protein